MVDERGPDGTLTQWPAPYTPSTFGELIYDASGRMSMQLRRQPAPRFASEQWASAEEQATPAEMSAAYHAYSAYFGTYEVRQSERIVIHRVQGALFPNLEGIDQKRRFEVSGDELVLMPPPIEIAGELRQRRLKWKRADAVDLAARSIEPSAMRADVEKLASDEFEGRGVGTRGDRKTRDYLISQMKALGLRPGAANGAWEQPFDLVGISSIAPALWRFEYQDKSITLDWRKEYVAYSGVQSKTASVDRAEVVFVGYGIDAPEVGWNDYKNQDVRGKVLLMLGNDPDWDPTLFAGSTRLYYGYFRYKFQVAAERGAAAAIIIHTTPSAGFPWHVVQNTWTGEQFELPDAGEPRVQVRAWIGEESARQLTSLAGQDLEALIRAAKSRDFRPVSLGVSTSLSLANKLSRVKTANVLGVLPGSDAKLRDEAVVYSAHHDHMGIGPPDLSSGPVRKRGAKQDHIYNGALDNGAGMAQVLAVARAFAALPTPPRRSVLMAFVGAEERGLLGSKYYIAQPTFPLNQIVANLNFDGGNVHGRTQEYSYIGRGKTTLDAAVDLVAHRYGRIPMLDQVGADRGMFYRSDQLSFARAGIPALLLRSWRRSSDSAPDDYEQRHYHRPSDEVDESWNFDGLVDDARVAFQVGLITANADLAPEWVRGDEFEAIRKAARP